MPNFYFYLSFVLLITVSLGMDIFFFKKNMAISFKASLIQILFWFTLSLCFALFLYHMKDSKVALKYVTGYFLELSLSLDNIFIFILIFSSYQIAKKAMHTALLLGILFAIVIRIIFIYTGITLIEKFSWLLYLFGIFLIYMGIKIAFKKEAAPSEKKGSRLESLLYRLLPITKNPNYATQYFIRIDKKLHITSLSLVVLLIAFTDIIFAMDSIPTIIAVIRENIHTNFSSDDILVIYSSNIFALICLRPLFLILQKAHQKFFLLSYAIAFLLVYIGIKMLLGFFEIHIENSISLVIVIGMLILSIILSSVFKKYAPQ